MKHFFYIVSFACLLLSSCLKQSGKTTVEGKVIDEYTSKGIPNATVVLEAENSKLYWGGSGAVAEYDADEYGNFSFSFDADADYVYRVNARKDNLYMFSTNEPSINKGRRNKSVEVKLWPMAFLKFHVVEVDSVKGSYLTLIGLGCAKEPLNLVYAHINETIYCWYRWSKNETISWGTRPSTEFVRKDTTISQNPQDTADIDIFY